MKKLLSTLIILFTLFSTVSASYAQTGTKTSSLTDIKYTKGSPEKVTLYTSVYKGYTVTYLPNPDRMIVDIPNNKLAVSKTIAAGGAIIKNIRFSQFTATSVRIVFDIKSKLTYKVDEKNGALTFTLQKSKSSAFIQNLQQPSRGDVERPTPTPVVTPAPVSTPDPVRISYESTDNGEKITIPGGNYAGYTVTRMTNPNRIILNVPNLFISPDQIVLDVEGKLIHHIRTAQINNYGDIGIYTNGQPQYDISSDQQQLTITVTDPTLRNMNYSNDEAGGIYLTLQGVKMTEVISGSSIDGSVEQSASESATLKKLYTESYDSSGRIYTVTFQDTSFNIGAGILQINDGVINTISISNNPILQTTSMTFDATKKLAYEIITNPETNETKISILVPAVNEKLVVIDAGHGGSDPGAQYAGINEKDLNLKISLMVNDILKSKGVKTYMTRTDDTFVALHDRADIANNLNATLFLCIHNNAYNKSECGTETLYYPNDSSKAFAKIVQNSLIKALGTKDRGIVKRPDLVVLNSTKMPAVLAEIAFITNDSDRAKLLDDSFLSKAASALADAVISELAVISN